MTQAFHLAFLGRQCTVFGDTVTFTDGLPPPTEQELAGSHDAAWAEWYRQQNPPKRWPDTEAFVAEFTMQELAAISLSTDQTVAALRLLLAGWRSDVHSDDPRVTQGVTALFLDGIIEESRIAEILT